MQFLLLLDDVGAEFTYARINRREMIAPIGKRVVRERPIAVAPLEVIQPQDRASRAAGGFLLLGAFGAALGVLTSKGPAVRFELQFADCVRQGVIPQSEYSRFRRKIEKMQSYRPGDLTRLLLAWTGGILSALFFAPLMGPFAILVGGGLGYGGHALAKRRKERTA